MNFFNDTEANICLRFELCFIYIEILFSIFVKTFSCWAFLSQLIVVKGESEGGTDIGTEAIDNNLSFSYFFCVIQVFV